MNIFTRPASIPRWTVAALIAVLLLTALLPVAGRAEEGDDPLRPQQWGLDVLEVDNAFGRSTGEDVVIAILDSGVDLDHPDLVDKLVPGWDFIENDDQPQDENGHGTHVAGIAAATTDNGIGISGAAPDAKIMPVRVMDRRGAGSADVIANAIVWAAENGADVINLSLGGNTDLLSRIFKSGPMNQAIISATDAGAVVVAAAGNDDTFIQAYRDDVPVLIVNASNEAGLPAQFTNWGDPRAVTAPGTRILSTAPTEPTTIWRDGTDGYAILDGTSMAAPYVAGVAALLVDTRRGDEPLDIINHIVETSENEYDDPRLGAGIVNADEAVARSDINLLLLFLIAMAFIVAIVGGIWYALRRASREEPRPTPERDSTTEGGPSSLQPQPEGTHDGN